MAGSGCGGGAGGGGAEQESGCSFGEEWSKAWKEAADNAFTVDNFLSNAILGAITGKLGKLIAAGANKVLNAAGDLATSTIDTIFGATTDLTVGTIGGAVNAGSEGLSVADGLAIGAGVVVGLGIGALTAAAIAAVGGGFAATLALSALGLGIGTLIGQLLGALADAYDAAKAAYDDCLENEEEQEPEDIPGDGPFECPPVSPLILDLDNDGVETVSLADANVRFDLDGDGFADQTGWVAADDGLLALDRNADGTINDINELFGNATQDGFSELAEEDLNGDGVIDANDDVYDLLRVWQDANQDGISQEDELKTLEELGIESIDLTATEVDGTTDAGIVTHEGTATLTGGGTIEIEDVWFDNEINNSVLADQIDISINAARLPLLEGAGRVPSLHIAMTEDDNLLQSVRQLLINMPTQSSSEFRADFEAMILDWTGADEVSVASGGAFINGQHLAALEALFDQDYLQLTGVNAGRGVPGPNAGFVVEQQYQDLIDRYLTHFTAQSASASIDLAYDLYIENGGVPTAFSDTLATSDVLALADLMYDDTLNRVTLASAEQAIEDVIRFIETQATDALGYLDRTLSKLVGIRQDQFNGSETLFEEWLREQLAPLGDEALIELGTAIGLGKAVLRGTDGAESLTTFDEKPEFLVRQPVPIGSILASDAGDDVMDGQAGGDLYVFNIGDGSDRIVDSFFEGIGGFAQGTTRDTFGNRITDGVNPYLQQPDKVVFLGRTSDQAEFTFLGDNLLITFTDGTGDSLRIDGFFAVSEGREIDDFTYATGQYGIVEKFVFQDRTIDFRQLQFADLDDAVIGSIDSDTIIGTQGDETLIGLAGDDLYLYALGDGSDIIDENGNSTGDYDKGAIIGDILQLQDINLADITLTRTGDNVEFGFSDGNTITILNQGFSTSLGSYTTNAIEVVRFGDGAELRVDVIDVALNGAGAFPNSFDETDADAGGLVASTGFRANEVFSAGSIGLTLNGSSGHDTYILEATDAPVTIVDKVVVFDDINRFEDDEDTLILPDYAFEDLEFVREGIDMIVSVGGVEIARVESQYRDNFTFGIERRDGVERIIDSTLRVFVQTDWEERTLTRGTDGDDFVRGIDYLRNDDSVYFNGDVYDLGLGDDTVEDENGSEIYLYRSGDGNDEISDNFSDFRYDPGNDTDRLRLLDLNLEDVRLARIETFGFEEEGPILFGVANSLEIQDLSTGQTITVTNQFIDEQTGLEEIEFADGTVLLRDQIEALSFTFGTEFNDRLTIQGTAVGLEGDDQIEGFTDADRALYASGDGNDEVFGIETLEFTDLNSADVRLERTGDQQITITILSTGETIELNPGFGGPIDPPIDFPGPIGRVASVEFEGNSTFAEGIIEQIIFANGEIWDVSEISANIVFPTTDGDDDVTGSTDGDQINGGLGNDTINGDAGDDLLRGGLGLDTVLGGAGNDTILATEGDIDATVDGGAGFDLISFEETSIGVEINLATGNVAGTPIAGFEAAKGSSGNDTITGDDGDNLLDGFSGDDSIDAGAGNDLVTGGRGADDMDGGAGDDAADYSRSLGGVEVSLTDGTGAGGDAEGDTLANFEGVIGSNYSDNITGDSGNNLLVLNNGNDTGTGLDGDDLIFGGNGTDTLDGGAGNDGLFGGAGRDDLIGDTGNDTLDGGTGADLMFGGEGSDTIIWQRGDGDDVVIDDGAGAGDVDTLRLTGIFPSEVNFTRIGNALFVSIIGGGTIRIEDQFLGNGIETIAFEDGSILDRSAFEAAAGLVANREAVALDDDTGITITGTDPVEILTEDLLENDFDINGDALSLVSVQDAVGGTVEINAAGNVEFTTDGTNGAVSFTYTITDGDLTDTATVTLEVDLPINNPPVLDNEIADQSSPEDNAVSISIPADTFSDPDGNTLTLTATLADGSDLPDWLTFDGTTFSGTPPLNFNGTLDIEVTASDGEFSVSDTFVLEITPVNDAPELANALADQTSPEDTALTFAIPPDAFADVDGDALTLTATLADGSNLPDWLTFDGTTFSGTPPLNFNGTLEVEVTASDGELTAADTFALEITPVNDAPTATDDAGFTANGTDTLDFLPDALLANDSDVDGDTLSIASVTSGTGGQATLNGDGSVSFTADAGFTGTATFTYTATDGDLTDTAQVSVEVEDDPFGDFNVIEATSVRETLEGTDAADIFVFEQGDSNLFRLDCVENFEAGDRIDVTDFGFDNVFTGEGERTADSLIVFGNDGAVFLIGGRGFSQLIFKVDGTVEDVVDGILISDDDPLF